MTSKHVTALHLVALLVNACDPARTQDFLNGVCTHIIWLTKKKLTYYTGNYDTFRKTVRENEVIQMKKYHKEQDDIKHLKEFIASCGTYSNLVKQARPSPASRRRLHCGERERAKHQPLGSAIAFKVCSVQLSTARRSPEWAVSGLSKPDPSALTCKHAVLQL